MPHSWNLSEWIDALGLRRPDQPDLIYAVQPVEIVGNHSAFAAPLLPPTAWSGGSRAAVAATYAGFQFTSLAPGGAFVREVHSRCAGAGPFRWLISQTPATMANVVTPIVNEMGDTPTSCAFRIGTFAAEPAGGATNWGMTNTTLVDVLLLNSFYIPPGSTLEYWFGIVNQAVDFSIRWEERPSPRSER